MTERYPVGDGDIEVGIVHDGRLHLVELTTGISAPILIGGGLSRQEAVEDAVRNIEAIEAILQGPPPGVTT